MADKSQKTEKATPRHRKESRDKGMVAKSPELGAWAGLLVIVSVLPTLGGTAAARITSFFELVLTSMTRPTTASAQQVLGAGLGTVTATALPVLLVATAVGIGSSYAQVGLRFTPKAVLPRFSRVSPRSGLTRIVSVQGLWSLGKTVLKMAILAGVGWTFLHELMRNVLVGSTLPLPTTVAAAAGTTLSLVRDVGAVALVIAGADYAVQRRTYQQNLRMTKQEVRDEFRRNEGNPEIRRAVRQRGRQLSRLRMMAAVASADVVVTNPTHYAVAIAYERGVDGAPRVVAKGQDHTAARIRARARACGVPIVENPPLARTLHAACEVDTVIPPRLYEAVAQLLAFVYSLTPTAKALAEVHRIDHLRLRLAG